MKLNINLSCHLWKRLARMSFNVSFRTRGHVAKKLRSNRDWREVKTKVKTKKKKNRKKDKKRWRFSNEVRCFLRYPSFTFFTLHFSFFTFLFQEHWNKKPIINCECIFHSWLASSLFFTLFFYTTFIFLYLSNQLLYSYHRDIKVQGEERTIFLRLISIQYFYNETTKHADALNGDNDIHGDI